MGGACLTAGAGLAAPAAPAQGAQKKLPEALTKVLEDVKAIRAQGERHPVVVFDLDATLFDNRERTRSILAELALEPDLAGTAAGEKLLALQEAQVEYMVSDTLKAVGLEEPALVKRATDFWLPRFFSDVYATHDRVIAGGPAYVRALYDAGAFVVYLSGRDRPRMLVGTVQSLAGAGYPVGLDRTLLLLKPDPKTDDEAFKTTIMESLGRMGPVVGLFDNEPANVNLMYRAFPKAVVVFLETMHSPNPPAVLEGIVRMPDFAPR